MMDPSPPPPNQTDWKTVPPSKPAQKTPKNGFVPLLKLPDAFLFKTLIYRVKVSPILLALAYAYSIAYVKK